MQKYKRKLKPISQAARAVYTKLKTYRKGCSIDVLSAVLGLDKRVVAPLLNGLYRRGFVDKTDSDTGIIWIASKVPPGK